MGSLETLDNQLSGSRVHSDGGGSIIYGPVPSWRLGRSLGIDLLSTRGKTCSFDCIYCQLGRTVHFLYEPREFVPLSMLASELEQIRSIKADYATLSGSGEPTLASNLGQAIKLIRERLGLRVAVLTNSSLMPQADVRQRLARADMVVAKLDAPDPELFHRIDKPSGGFSFNEILEGIRVFRREFDGKLALQMMFIAENRDHAREMAELAREISPDEVQLNTPLRPCAVQPLSPGDISAIRPCILQVQERVDSVRGTKTRSRPIKSGRDAPAQAGKGNIAYGSQGNYIE